MSKFVRLLMTGALVLAMASSALAAETRVSGSMDFSFGKAFLRGDDQEKTDYVTRQRFRSFIDFIVSENLKGVLGVEIGEANWGNVGENTAAGQGFSIGGDGVSIEVKSAYIDWQIPSTALWVRMGLQPIALPDAVAGNPVLDDDMAGIVLNYAFNDQVGATLFWATPGDRDDKDFYSSNAGVNDDVQLFGLSLPIELDGASINPYAMYMMAGENSGAISFADDNTNAWWAGLALEVGLWDPLVLKLDAIYGSADTGSFDTRGFFIAAAADYKLENCTPGLFAFYSSGADKDDLDGWMPTISPAGFGPTSTGLDGAAGINPGAYLSDSGIGMWGIGVQIADLSFIEKMSHVVRLAYYRGTNDKEITYNVIEMMDSGDVVPALTTKDWAWEVNFDSTYEIYDNLSATLELGYVGTDYDADEWEDMDGIFKVGLAMEYTF